MTQNTYDEISFDEYDEIDNPGPEQTGFEQVLESALSRRSFLRSGVVVGASAFVMSSTFLGSKSGNAHNHVLDFQPVQANSLDTVTVPKGYNWQVVAKWGDPLWSKGSQFDQNTRGTASTQALAFGDNNDGMSLFKIDGRNVLVVNNEYTNRSIMFGNRESGKPETQDDILKGKAAHGVSVVEVTENNGKWSIVKDSKFNRRITADTPMEITGPARGHDLLKTSADPKGEISLGTWNNCGNGRTPWGTYLACEENFNGYFSSSDESFQPTAEMSRYGIKTKDWGYAWAKQDSRFDISKEPNEPNRAGYIVEIDPANPSSTPKKRTALGR
ncbi:MAG: DUF839 domain-containing protein, partial [Alphaproteobacteria bacterium]|nr:DUF839 domain-containing protein [Alphaproteobacteria bacterium]